MKKIIVFILFFTLIFKVNAKEVNYYSDYSDYYYTDEEVAQCDLVEVSNYKKHLYYKYVYNDYGYDIYLGDDFDIDYSDYIKTDYSDYLKKYEIPDSGDIEVVSKDFYENFKLKKVRFLIIDDVFGSYDVLRISEIEVYKGDEYIDYDPSCYDCSAGLLDTIKSRDKTEFLSFVANGGQLTLDLGDYYYFDDLEIKIYLFDMTPIEKRYDLYVSPTSDISDSFLLYEFRDRFVIHIEENITYFEKDIFDYTYINPLFEEPYLSDEPDVSYPNKVSQISKYKYRNYLYRHYKNDLHLCEEKSEECDIKSEKYVEKYKYRIRDKLSLIEPIILSETLSVTDYVAYSSDKLEYEKTDDYITFLVGRLETSVSYEWEETDSVTKKPVYKTKVKYVDRILDCEDDVIINEDLYPPYLGESKESKPSEDCISKDRAIISLFPIFLIFFLLFLGKKVNDSIN